MPRRSGQRFSEWGRLGISAFYAASEDEIDAICNREPARFEVIVVFERVVRWSPPASRLCRRFARRTSPCATLASTSSIQRLDGRVSHANRLNRLCMCPTRRDDQW